MKHKHLFGSTVLAVVLSWRKMSKFSGVLLLMGFVAFMMILLQI